MADEDVEGDTSRERSRKVALKQWLRLAVRERKMEHRLVKARSQHHPNPTSIADAERDWREA